MRGRSRQVLARVLVTTLAALALAATPPAAGAQTTCAAPVPSDTQPGYTIADPWCDVPGGAPFAPLTDPTGAPLSEVHAGIDDGAAWRIEVPAHWNGDLVLHAHGYRGTGTTVGRTSYYRPSPLPRHSRRSTAVSWACCQTKR